MANYVVSTFTQDGYRVTIQSDDYPTSPRDDYKDSALGVIVASHRRYGVGDRKPTDAEDRAIAKACKTGNWEPLKRLMRLTEHAVEVLQVSLYDHGNITLRVGPPSDRWDSGTIGFIYATREQVEMMGAPLDSVVRQLTAEVKEYSAYLNGEVWEYVVEKITECPCCHNVTYEEVAQMGGYYTTEEARADVLMELKSDAINNDVGVDVSASV